MAGNKTHKGKASKDKTPKEKTRWDVYTWMGSGPITIRVSNVSLKEAKKAKEKWIAKSAKHEAFIAAHNDKKIVKDLLGETEHKVKPRKKKSTKAKSSKPSKPLKSSKFSKDKKR